jgi:adenylosuccinate synthase
MINQALEQSRGAAKHGSCGVGINETIQRNQYGRYRLTFKDLQDRELTRTKLHRIRNGWVILREHELKRKLDLPYLKEDGIVERYMTDVEKLLLKTTSYKPIEDYNISEFYRSVVFEGAQGLQLDMHNRQFPYVTRSHTGLKNVVELLEDVKRDWSKEQINVFYVTRTYLTRHGAGPMPHEFGRPYKHVDDKTNIFNKHQGDLRYSLLDVSYLHEAIKKDLQFAKNLNVKVHLVLTHCDQLDYGLVQFVHRKNQKCALPLARFVEMIGGMVGADKVFTVAGPTRDDFSKTFQSRVAKSQ